MLQNVKLEALNKLVSTSTKDELIWMNGYLAGLIGVTVPATVGGPAEPVSTNRPVTKKITLLYGTETGNAKKLAGDFATRAKRQGIPVKLVSADQYRPADLSRESYLLVVISTQGDGEPPAAAKKLYDYIHQQNLNLANLKYAVLGLGDTAYPLFCKAAEAVDQRLHLLGGKRMADIRKCDTDYETDAFEWFSEVIQTLFAGTPSTVSAAVTPASRKAAKKLYEGTILSNIDLNDLGSGRHTHHIEISAEGVEYHPGDSLGIVPANLPATVSAVLEITGIDPNRALEYSNERKPVKELLSDKLQIVYLPERVVQQYAAVVQQEIPATRIDLIDLLKIYPVKDAGQFEEVIQILEPIAPRLYSISSSPEAHPDEVHLTVARDTFLVNDQVKYGLCSNSLADLKEGAPVQFYIHRNNQFRLPADDARLIMIGPGTGIAPFRSFLWEREAAGASGENWLFFGSQHFRTDFLYQTEIQNWVATGVLSRISLAFSRDQQQKVYVQHKMQAQAAELYDWLQTGAYVYICGAKEPMSLDVEQTLLGIVREQGRLSDAAALEYLERLKEEGRYLKDVY